MNRFETSSTRSIGAVTLVCLVVASMIGVGVFTSSGFALAAVGNPNRVMLAWTLCGLWALCGAVGYGALASRVPYSGGEYLYLSRLVHPSIGFLAGWISLVAGFTAPIATVAKAAAAYCVVQAEASPLLENQIASGLLVFATLAYLAGLSIGTTLQNVVVAVKLLLIFAFVVWGFGFTPDSVWQGGALPNRDTQVWPEGRQAWSAFLGSMSYISLSYIGFNAAIYVAGQSRAPQRTVSRSMLVATIAVTIVYLLLNAIFVYGPSPEAIAGKHSIAAIASRSLGGANMEILVRIIIALALISSLFSLMLAGPRVYWQMARDGVMPSFLDTQSTVPRAAVVAQCALSLIVVWLATVNQLISYLGLTLSACSALAIAAICRLRQIVPEAKPLTWWELACAVLYVLGTTVIIVAATFERPKEFGAFLATVGAGFVVFILWTNFSKK